MGVGVNKALTGVAKSLSVHISALRAEGTLDDLHTLYFDGGQCKHLSTQPVTEQQVSRLQVQ
jgi:hypothetical protein